MSVAGRGSWAAAALAGVCVVAVCAADALGAFRLLERRYEPCLPGRPAGLVSGDLIGRYVTAAGGELVLQASGRLTVRGVTIDFENRPLTLSGTGTWSLLPRDRGFGDMNLDVVEQRFGMQLQVSGTRSRPWLYRFVGDPDLCTIERFNRTGP